MIAVKINGRKPGDDRQTVSAELVKANPLTAWVRLPGGRIVQRKRRRRDLP